MNKKDIEIFLNSQEAVQVNTKIKGINLKITVKPRTFQIDIMYYKIGQTLSRTRVENVIEAIIDMYNDSPHRGIKDKTPNLEQH